MNSLLLFWCIQQQLTNSPWTQNRGGKRKYLLHVYMWGCVKVNIDMHWSTSPELSWRQVTAYTRLAVMWAGKSHFPILEVCTYSWQSCMSYVTCNRAMLKQWTSYIWHLWCTSEQHADRHSERLQSNRWWKKNKTKHGEKQWKKSNFLGWFLKSGKDQWDCEIIT